MGNFASFNTAFLPVAPRNLALLPPNRVKAWFTKVSKKPNLHIRKTPYSLFYHLSIHVSLRNFEIECKWISLTLTGPTFSVVHQARGGLRGPDAKSHSYHKPIEIKFFTSDYRYKSILDAKFESGCFSFFRDMMSQNFPLNEWNAS